VELLPIRTVGANSRSDAVREAVLDGKADIAVTELRDGWPAPDLRLVLGAVPQRGDPRDAMVSQSGKVLAYLPEGTRIATNTPNRAAQLLRRRSDLNIVPAADDVVDRLEQLGSGDCDAVVVSVASLDALQQIDRVTEYFDTDQLIPEACQGTIGLEHRKGDDTAAAVVAALDDPLSAYAATAERACVAGLAASDDTPVGVFAITDGDHMFIHGIVTTPDGTHTARLRWSGPWREAREVGATLAELLLSAGGEEILAGGPMPPTINYAELQKQRLADEWEQPYPPEEA
jgi:hydroxymethylbilane synthase